MARIDLDRRAQIGRERRERTRSALVAAAKRLLSESPIENVNVDDVVQAAGLAKGTFYYHFRDFGALISAIGEELATEFDELLQSQRSSFERPLERFAWGQFAFFRRAEIEPRWGRLVRYARFAEDSAAASVRRHLATDLEDARRDGALGAFTTAFALPLVMSMAIEFLDERDAGPPRRPAAGAMVEAILRALGVDAGTAVATVMRVSAAAAELEAHIAGRTTAEPAGIPLPGEKNSASRPLSR